VNLKILSYVSESFEPLLPIALICARVYVVLIALVGEIFGQMFFGAFSLASTITGVSAIFAGALGGLHCKANATKGKLVFVFCIAALGGTAAQAIYYYMKLDIPGNDFAWELRAPFILALLFIGYVALPLKRQSKQGSN
jgi:hypothetical protein